MNFFLCAKEFTRNRLFLLILAFLMVNIVADFVFSEINMVIVLISSAVLVWKSRNEIGSSIVFLLLLFSMIQISPEFLFNVRTTGFDFFYQEELYNIVIAILMVFTSILAVFYNQRRNEFLRSDFTKENGWVFSVLILISIYILIFGINRGTSSTYVYVVSITTIYEYFVMIYILAYYYSSKSKISNLFLMLLGFFYIIQDFYYGGRISSVQLTILSAILFFPKVKFKHILLLLLPAYLTLRLVEIYRTSNSFFDMNFLSVFANFKNPLENYQWNTFAEVLYSSSGLVYAKNAVHTIIERLISFTDFIINIFIGGVRPFGNIISYISANISPVGGGGFLPAYFYYWLGWGGVILISFFVVKMLNLESKERLNDFWKIVYILTLSMFPRWFYYSPLILIRFILFNFLIIYSILKIIDLLTKKYLHRIQVK